MVLVQNIPKHALARCSGFNLKKLSVPSCQIHSSCNRPRTVNIFLVSLSLLQAGSWRYDTQANKNRRRMKVDACSAEDPFSVWSPQNPKSRNCYGGWDALCTCTHLRSYSAAFRAQAI